MKQLLPFLLVTLFLQSCKKDKMLGPDHVAADIRINGNDYTIDDNSSYGITRSTFPFLGYDYISISGWTSLSDKLWITLPANTQVGVYTILALGGYTASYHDNTNQLEYDSIDSSGTITIEKVSSTYIKGTFQVNCYGSGSQVAEITNGSFEGDL